MTKINRKKLIQRLKEMPRQGEKGERGEKGDKGEKGEQGKEGRDGKDGKDRAKGEQGEKGEQGKEGRDGKDGKDGAKGEQGKKGEQGEKGDTGEKGEDSKVPGPRGLPGIVQRGDVSAGSSKILLAGALIAAVVGAGFSIDVAEGNINHDALLNTHNLTTDIDHGSIAGLTHDDHTQYALLAGRAGGQAFIGGTASGENLSLQSNSSNDGLVIAGQLGAEKVANPSFTGQTSWSGWGANWVNTGGTAATWTWSAGTQNLTGTMTGAIEVGKTYQISLDIVAVSGEAYIRVYCGNTATVGNEVISLNAYHTAPITIAAQFTAVTNDICVIQGTSADVGSITIDNISIKEVTKDILYATEYVGIGTNRPQAPMHLVSPAGSHGMIFEGYGGQSSSYLTFRSSGVNGGGGASMYFDASNGWLKIDNSSFQFTAGYAIMIGAASVGGISNAGDGIYTYTARTGHKFMTDGNFVLTGKTTGFGDGLRRYIGEGQDAYDEYNAVDWVLNPKAVGTGKIITGGDLTLGDIASLGTELVTNGNFAGGDTGWTVPSGFTTASGNLARTIAGTGHLPATQAVTTTAGKLYLVQYDISVSAGTIIQTFAGQTKYFSSNAPYSTSATYKYIVRATAASETISFDPTATSARCVIDNVTIKEIGAGDLTVGDITASGNSILGGTANYSKFDTNGKYTAYGTARVEKHIHFYTTAIKKGATPPAEAIIGNVPVLQFSNVSVDEIFLLFHVPTDWDTSTDLNFHIHWAPDDANAGDVAWKFDYRISKSENNELISGTDATLSVTDSAQSLQYEHLQTANVTIAAASVQVDDKIALRIYRDTGDAADTYGDVANMILAECVYTSNSHGIAL